MRTNFFVMMTCTVIAGACDGRTSSTPLAAPEQPLPALPGENEAETPASAPARASAETPDQPRVGAAPGIGMRLAFDNEPRDATWAQPLETLVASVVKTTGKARLVSAECKTTVCKVVASHPPGRVAATWGQTLSWELGQAFPDKPYRGAFMYEQTLDMTVSTTYFTRNGFGEHHPDGSPRKKRQPAPSP